MNNWLGRLVRVFCKGRGVYSTSMCVPAVYLKLRMKKKEGKLGASLKLATT